MNKIVRENHVFDKEFAAWAKDKPEVVALSGDLTRACECGSFAEAYPDRFYSMGIAEQNMMSVAGGMAKAGAVPFVFTFAVFMYRRAYDQIAMSIAYPNRKVRMIGFLPGVTSPAGATHQAFEDIALMRSLPNMTVLECADAQDIRNFLKLSEEIDGPIYVRMARGALPQLFEGAMDLGKAKTLTEGNDLVVLSSGICTEEAERAVAAVSTKGIAVKHMHVSSFKPLKDDEMMEAIANSKYGVITMENHTIIGGLGSIVAEQMAERGMAKKLYRMGVNDTFLHAGTQHYLMKEYGLDAMALIAKIEEATGQKFGIDENELEDFQLETVDGITRPFGF